MRRVMTMLAVAALTATAPASAHAEFGISLGPAPAFPGFVPGEDTTYAATMAATVASDEPGAVLTIEDAGAGTPAGHLRHPTGAALADPLHVAAQTAAPGATGSAPSPLGAGPVVLATYTLPLAAPDPIAISLSQRIRASEPLRSGRYATTLVLTLTSTTP